MCIIVCALSGFVFMDARGPLEAFGYMMVHKQSAPSMAPSPTNTILIVVRRACYQHQVAPHVLLLLAVLLINLHVIDSPGKAWLQCHKTRVAAAFTICMAMDAVVGASALVTVVAGGFRFLWCAPTPPNSNPGFMYHLCCLAG